jgi:hypothetical protein
MTIPTAAASPWPARCAYLSSAIFIGASGTTNIVYGWSKGDTLATSMVWATVAGAVAIVLALSWPALIRSVDAKRWSAAVISLVAMLLSGAYSVTAALGSAAGGRANAAATEMAAADARAKAAAAYDAAKAELDVLTATKPVAEIQTQIEAARSELAKLPSTRTIAELEALMRRACPSATALNGQLKTSCPKYDVELARAWERQRLTNKVAELGKDAERAEQRQAERRERVHTAMDKAAAELAAIRPAKVANSDAKALARYLAAVGLDITPDRLNDLLVLLAVVMVEVGGGLSLAVGMALSSSAREATAASSDTLNIEGQTARTPPANAPDALANAVSIRAEQQCPVVSGATTTRASDLAAWLRQQGGRAETSMRRLAAALGRSPSGVHEELCRLVASGLITAASGPRGTVLALV